MSLPYGAQFEQPSASPNKPHILSFATARSAGDDELVEVWNGPTAAARVFRINEDGQVQVQDGLVGAPALAPEDDKTTGLYFVSGTPEAAVAIAGSKVLSVVAAGVAVTGTLSATGGFTGNAATATALETARTINGVSFDGTANITVTAAAGTLTGSTLAAGVTASSLTSLGTLTSLTVNGALSVTTVNGLDVNPGSDVDADLITVGVTGAPRHWWDESEDEFRSTHGMIVRAGTGSQSVRSGCGLIYENIDVDATTAGTSRETLDTFTLLANTLARRGDSVRITIGCNQGNNSNSHTFTLSLGGTDIEVWDVGNLLDRVYVEITIVRINSTTIRYFFHRLVSNAGTAGGQLSADITVPDLGSNQDIDIDLQTPSSSGDATLGGWKIEYLPAAVS